MTENSGNENSSLPVPDTNPEQDRKQKTQQGKKKGRFSDDSPLGLFLLSMFFFAVGIWLYVSLDNLERSGESMRIHWLVALLYHAFGKFVTAGVILVFGCAFLIGSISKLKKKD